MEDIKDRNLGKAERQGDEKPRKEHAVLDIESTPYPRPEALLPSLPLGEERRSFVSSHDFEMRL